MMKLSKKRLGIIICAIFFLLHLPTIITWASPNAIPVILLAPGEQISIGYVGGGILWPVMRTPSGNGAVLACIGGENDKRDEPPGVVF